VLDLCWLFTFNNTVPNYKILTINSIFTVEALLAIEKAINLVNEVPNNILLTNPRSVLKSIRNPYNTHDITNIIINLLDYSSK